MVHTLFDKKYYFENQENIIDGVAIDPLLPDDFPDTPNEERDINELAHWWGRPFITTETFREDSYEAYCERMNKYELERFESEKRTEEKRNKQ